MVKNNIQYDSGRRKRLREDFTAAIKPAQKDEILLEILLSYAIPSKDLQPLVHDLFSRFGSLPKILNADVEELVTIPGIKEYSATLLKVVETIRKRTYHFEQSPILPLKDPSYQQSILSYEEQASVRFKHLNALRKGSGTGMVSKALMKEAIELLPQLPDTDDINIIRSFVRDHLRFNAESTRKRYSSYILSYLFPDDIVDPSILLFAKRYPNSPDLRAVCFYRFCKTYVLINAICEDLLIRNIGEGSIPKREIRDYLTDLFPNTKYANDGVRGFLEALTGAGIVRAQNNTLSFSYRPVSIPAFAFILHSEYPEPGMYDIGLIDRNEVFRSQLWHPDDILPALYELRNQGLISKVSEIDTMRQFTVKYSLEEVVKQMVTR